MRQGSRQGSRILLAAGMLAVAGTMWAAGAEAQQRRPGAMAPQPRHMEGMVFLGASQLDLNELNAGLARRGYPTFSSTLPQIGGVMSVGRQDIRLGLEFGGGARPSEVTADGRYRTELTAGYGMFNVGYQADAGGGFRVHPKLGIGGGGINLTIMDRSPANFDQLLLQPGRSSSLMHGSLLVDGSLGITYELLPEATSRGLRSLVLGVRAGYTTSVLQGGWMMHRTGDVAGGPDAGWGGPHVEFMIGRTRIR
jgi:hypothetical protein